MSADDDIRGLVRPAAEADRDEPTLVDLALGQGDPQALERLRQSLVVDPHAALEFAETRQLIERLRGATAEPTDGWQARMNAVLHASAQRQGWRRRSPRLLPQLVTVAVAAAALFAVLAVVDPLGLRQVRTADAVAQRSGSAVTAEPVPAPPPSLDSTMALAWDATRRLAPDSRLVDAWSRYNTGGPADRMSQWLSPRNAVAVMRLDHELRSSADARRQSLRDRGQLAAVEDRVQALARGVAADLQAGRARTVLELALGVRALVAAGTGYGEAIARGVEELEAALPRLEGGKLAIALAALAEHAATGGAVPVAALQRHGQRLVDEVVGVDGEVWSRRLPRLLAPATSADEVADAGRFLRLAPAFGIDPDQAMVVRLLLAANLQQRRDPNNETPEVPTALVYGFGDLLTADDRAELEHRLRVWRPSSLVPDFVALQQLAATREPRCVGYARWLLELRRICAVATPASLHDRAALCMCLATGFGTQAPRRSTVQG